MPITSMRYDSNVVLVETFVINLLVKDGNKRQLFMSFAGVNDSLNKNSMESLILAQDERWRRALYMQVER